MVDKFGLGYYIRIVWGEQKQGEFVMKDKQPKFDMHQSDIELAKSSPFGIIGKQLKADAIFRLGILPRHRRAIKMSRLSIRRS